MTRMPGTEARVVPHKFDGFITCSIRVPAAGYNDGCLVYGNIVLGSSQQARISFEAGAIQYVQTEMAWTPKSMNSERLCAQVPGVGLNDPVCGVPGFARNIN
jgi:hypothetical protein